MTIELTVLGSGAPFPTPTAPACSGYLVRSGASSVWVDCGPGTLAGLLGVTHLSNIDAIWVSHLHADHTADLVAALYALDDGGMSSAHPIPVLAPRGLGDRIGAFLGKDARVLDPFLTFHDLHDGHRFTPGTLTLTSTRVEHGPVEAYALRVDDSDGSLAYTGDSRLCPALVSACSGANLLLAEANHISGDTAEGVAADRVHLSADDAGELARQANVGSLVVTHVATPTSPTAAAARAASHFTGPIHLARPMAVIRADSPVRATPDEQPPTG